MSQSPTIIVGGGWAGLACGVHLAKQNYPVICLEAGPNLGGRARTIQFEGFAVDNGQHLLMGAYQETKALLELVNPKLATAIVQQPFEWSMLGASSHCRFNFAKAPSPFHLILGFLRAKGLNLKDKWRMSLLMRKLDWLLTKPDQSVAETLVDYQQSPRAIAYVWAPMCLAALTTPIKTASTHLFANVLKQALMQQPENAKWWFSAVDLGQLLPEPSAKFIQAHGGQILTHHRVTELIWQQGKLLGVKTKHGDYFGRVVLATPFKVSQQLMSSISHAQMITEQMASLRYESITTVYLYYPGKRLNQPMTGLCHGLAQWVFDRSFANQVGLIAVVISGNGNHLTLNHQALITQIDQELNHHWPHLGTYQAAKVIHEKRGAFRASVDCQTMRPQQITPVQDLYLAGDYTFLPYPSTLEGAVLSGKICANHIVRVSNERTAYANPSPKTHAIAR